MIFNDALKALGQIGDPAFRGVLIRGIGLTVLLLAAITGVSLWLLGVLLPDQLVLPFVGPVTWFDDIALGGALVLLLVGSVFLMIPTASAFTSLFLDEVAEAVERRHYPSLPKGRSQPLGEAIVDSLRFLGVIVGANLVALLAYLLMPPAAPVIFLAMNGFLLGREYFQLVAVRRMSRAEAKALRRRHSGEIWLAGVLMALPLTVPLMNLLVPVLGAATFTHLYQRLAARS